MMTDGNQTYLGDHFIVYINFESLCCTRETYNILRQLYLLKTKKERERKK